MKEKAVKYFLNGYSCSESVVQAAIDKGYVSNDLLQCASPFSCGMGIRCLCGAVAGAMLVIGAMFGKNQNNDGMQARALSKAFNDKFHEKYNVNCCKVLSAGFKDFHSSERKQHCTSMVNDSCEILENLLKNSSVTV